MSNLDGSFLNNQEPKSSFTQGRHSGAGVAANLASHGKFLNNGNNTQSKSFAQEMAALLASGEEIPPELQSKLDEMGYQVQDRLPNDQKATKPHLRQGLGSAQGFTSGEELVNKAQLEKENIRQEDVKKAIEESRNQDRAERQSEEKKHYYSSDESTKAVVAQENSQAITEGVREGNVAQQEQRQSEDGQRQQQLANWELLAPRLIEDSKNRAIRLDIPDVHDIQTVIVRMGQSGVDIQAVGSADMVDGFANREGLLRGALAKKNIKLGAVRAFDAKSLG